jgi:glycosyltransferase involved in cell wall biosynthesis
VDDLASDVGQQTALEHIRRLEAEVEALLAERGELTAEVEALRAKIPVLGSKLDNLQSYCSDLEKRHLELLRSRSWTSTEPLRRAVRLVTRKKTPSPFVPRFVSSRTDDRGSGRSGSQARKLASRLRRAVVPGQNEAAARAQVLELKRRLLNLGYSERGYLDLKAFFETASDRDRRRLAGFELAVWHANRYAPEDAETCLHLLDAVEATGIPPDMARRIAVLRAESLDILGRREEALDVLLAAEAVAPHADLYLAQCHLQASEAETLAVLNRALALHGLAPVRFSPPDGRSLYDRLEPAGADGGPGQVPKVTVPRATVPKVTVIVPVFNAEATISTTLDSLLSQTWANLEILVSDDCSTDGTVAVVEHRARVDPRLRLIRGPRNAGPYVARNLALREATGDYVTCNDSDDWSHPEKIERQVRHLMTAPDVVANTSQQARATNALRMFRRGNPGFYLQLNMSSLMFRRETVLDAVGYWDSVRFGADSEFTKRLRHVFGKEAVVDLETGPLSFQRQTSGSLTASSAFGYSGFKMGARKVYEDRHKEWHAREARPRIDFPLSARPFPVPEPMRPVREVRPGGRRRFDVVLVSDFRLPGGTSMSNIEEIKAQRRLGLRTGLVQMGRYDLNPARGMNPKIAEMIDGDRVDLLVKGEAVDCDLLLLRLPWVLEEFQSHLPEVAARDIRVIINQPPKRDYAPGSPYIYHLQRCLVHLERHFGAPGIWHPIGPLVRQALLDHHAEELEGIPLSSEDWPNIIDLDEWQRPLLPPRGTGRIRICRHSRDHYVKWPAARDDLLKVYPNAPDVEIHVLGGAETPKALFGGRLPPNWHVTAFGRNEPATFLAAFDVFVYYTHPDWVESFGRVVFEAMAVGLPVFLPPVYRPLFGDAAIYAEPAEVEDKIRALMADPAAYEAQVSRARTCVADRFGYACHARRVGAILGTDLTHRLRDDPLASGTEALKGEAGRTTSFDEAALTEEMAAFQSGKRTGAGRFIAGLVAEAEAALGRGPYSVVDKSTLPPSGNRHDYWHPAPYWWPDPRRPDGLPYIRRDGVRVPGTLMYDPDSERYDRTRLQRLFDDSTLLTLAWRATGNETYAQKAVAHLERFFVDPTSRMTAHLEYAQVKLGHNGNRGSSSGIIEFKDFYYYLDAVRLLTADGILSGASLAAFRDWLECYLRWLLDSRQGRSEVAAANNHGTYYDLQVAAIASFLDNRVLLMQTLRRARARLAGQFTPEGAQPEELRRTTTAHYCCYNLQGWISLSHLAARWGVDLWRAGEPGGIQAGASWLVAHAGRPWPYTQIDAFDSDRFSPLWHMLPRELRPERPAAIPLDAFAVKPVFHPHDGIRPYWNLGLAQ